MKIIRDYLDYPDAKDFHPFWELAILMTAVCLLSAVIISGSVYGFYDWLDKKNTAPIIREIENIK